MTLSIEEKKSKARWYHIKRTYGLEKEDYAKLDLGSCPICLRVWDSHVRPVVDHDHGITKMVRGVVCAYCNFRVIGKLRDPALVYRLYEYLAKAPTGYIVPPKPKKKRKKRIKK